jgi:hypothetical protein
MVAAIAAGTATATARAAATAMARGAAMAKRREFRRGDNDGNRSYSRNQAPQQNMQSARRSSSPPPPAAAGAAGVNGGSRSSAPSGDRPSGGPSGRFGTSRHAQQSALARQWAATQRPLNACSIW